MTKEELVTLLEESLGPLPTMVTHQIKKFKDSGLTYKQIGRAVYYYFEVLKRDKSSIKTYGIGIVPLLIDESENYYNNLKQQKDKQERQLERIKDVPIREIKPEKRNRRKREVDINEL